MATVRGKKFGGNVEVLRHKDFTAIPVTIDGSQEVDGKAIKLENGRKVVKAGAILGTGLLKGKGLAKVDNTATADGVLRYDVDITDGNQEASLVIRGEVFEDKLPEALGEGVEEALASRILFIK